MPSELMAGAATADITPKDSQFLYGYPHIERYSTGVHDPLLAVSLYLSDGQTGVLFIATDSIYITKASTQRVRERIAAATSVPADNILISCSHTHSAPKTMDSLACSGDPIVPKVDPKYLQLFEDGIVSAGRDAFRNAKPAEVGLAVADATGVGTNRHDPAGPRDLQVPVLMVRSADGRENIAAMIVLAMHPTVLHEDSTLVSGDFPAMGRQYLQKNLLGKDFPVVYHIGAAGDQSPRHVTKANTFAEAERLGEILGKAVAKVIPSIEYRRDVKLNRKTALVDLPIRKLPSLAPAQAGLDQAIGRLKQLSESNVPRTEVRTAECDWFGAEETMTLARATEDGRIKTVAATCLPAEVQVIAVGPWSFVAWPGEFYVDFAIQVRSRHPDAFVITMANGDLQAYLVTQEAVDNAWYESGNAIFQSPAGPRKIVEATLRLLEDRSSQ